MDKDVFEQFMELMKLFMKSHGFTKKGNNFYKRHPQGNIGIINFQKDPSGSSFTVNVSIYSYVLAEAFLVRIGEEVKKYPSEYDGHWRSRISGLVPRQSPEYINLANSKNIEKRSDGKWDGHDAWWNLCNYSTFFDDNPDAMEIATLAKELFEEVSPLIAKFAIPAIDQHLTDEQLKNHWFSSTNSNHLQYLATFFLASGEEEKLNIVLNKLGKYVQDNPQYTGLKRRYDTFMRERRWVDDTYIQELELYWSEEKKRREKRKERRKEKQQREQ